MRAMRVFMKLTAVTLMAAVMPQFVRAGDSDQQPNIIMVFIDNMGWADLSCFGNKDARALNIDFLPSLLKLTGAKSPAYVSYDGEEILNTLLGKSETSRKAPFFFSRPPDRKDFYDFQNLPDLAVRHGKWKLLCDYDGGRPNLFNVITDPGESTNLAEKYPEIITWYQSM